MSWQPISQRMSWDDYLGQGKAAGPSVGMNPEDTYWQRATENLDRTYGLDERKLKLMEEGMVPPSKWATGTQAFGGIAQGLAGLGSIYLGLQGMKEQKKMNKFNMGMANTNMNNSILDYNRRLEGTLQNRALNNGGGQGYVSEQLARYSARRSG